MVDTHVPISYILPWLCLLYQTHSHLFIRQSIFIVWCLSEYIVDIYTYPYYFIADTVIFEEAQSKNFMLFRKLLPQRISDDSWLC